jgi:transposase-like protein
MRIGKLATKFMNMFKVNGQDSLLHADETEMMLKGDYFWNWNVIMKGNRFLLVNFSSLTRNMESAKAVFREAKNKLIGLPLKIITDGLPAYPGAINSAFYRLSYPRVEHVVSPGFEGRPDNNFVERIHNEIQARVITMRGFKSFESAAATMSLWALFYNFLRSHAALSGKTPAEAAGLGSYTLSGIIGEAYEQDRRDKRTG